MLRGMRNTCEQAKDTCHVVGECTQGKCSNPIAKNGKQCDDDDDTTKDDACKDGTTPL